MRLEATCSSEPPSEGSYLHATARQLEAIRLRVLGLTYQSIGENMGISPETVNKHIDYCVSQNNLPFVFLVEELINSGQLDVDELATHFDFNRYEELDGRQRRIFQVATDKENWERTMGSIASDLEMAEQTLKNQLCGIYDVLGIRHSISRARVYRLIAPSDLMKV